MDAIANNLAATLQRFDLHPVADHFTIGLLVVGVFLDLVASLVPTRIWLRYTAATLMVFGALAAGASYLTGDLEADRLFNNYSSFITDDIKAVFTRHATVGT